MAIKKAGGLDQLKEAITGGRVQQKQDKVLDKMIDFYFFPEVNIGTTESVTETVKLSRNKTISDGDFKEMADTMAGIKFVFATDKNAKAIADAAQAGEAIPQELETHLFNAHTKFNKVVNAGKKTLQDAEGKLADMNKEEQHLAPSWGSAEESSTHASVPCSSNKKNLQTTQVWNIYCRDKINPTDAETFFFLNIICLENLFCSILLQTGINHVSETI